jgi:hypothetical protein
MANRITDAFARIKAQIADCIAKGLTTAEKIRDVHKTLDMDLAEYVKFQTLKTLAVAQGLLTPDEAQSVYFCLGESMQKFNDQPVHVKSVLTSLFAELLTAQVRRRGDAKNASRIRRQASAARV